MALKKLLFFTVLTFFLSNFALTQWQFVGFQTGVGSFPSISVSGPNTVAIGGGPNGQPKVYLSINGGVNWTTLGTTGLGTLEFYCIWMKDANTIFTGDGGAVGGAGGNASYYKTTDGGATWTVLGSTGGSAGFINGIVFSNTNPMFGVTESDPPLGAGQPYYLSITTDGGVTWTVTNPPGVSGAASAQNSIVVIDDQWYGFGMNAGASRVYYTSNGGSTWNVGNLGIAGSFISGFAMSTDKLRGIAISNTSLPNVARTTNGGQTWTSVNTGGDVTGYGTVKWIEGTDIVYISGQTGASGVVKKSTDGGVTWSTMTTGGITGLTHMEFFKDVNAVGITIYGYAVAGDGSVIKLVDMVTSLNPVNSEIPTEFKLQQNFPNPFNPVTTINFSIPKSSHVTLKVFNSIGQEVASIVNKYLPAGNYSEQFAATSNLTSGVYFYKLTADGFSDTKKLMLVK